MRGFLVLELVFSGWILGFGVCSLGDVGEGRWVCEFYFVYL